MYAIEAKGLEKKYKEKTAVDGLDLAVKEGELFALLGVNGAGKTTTIRMLSCLSEPTKGEAFICSHSCKSEREAVKKLVGISPQDTAVADNLSVQENLVMMCGIFGFDKEKTKKETDRMISLFSMEEVKNSKAKTLSGGWKRKLSIAMALICGPKVLFLDEPTLGLDVLARRELWSIISGLKSKITIVLTTHYMEEAEQLADRIAIMIDGKCVSLGTLSELEEKTGEKGLENAFVKIAEEHGKGAGV